MGFMDAVKNDIGKLKNVFTPEVIEKAALIGGAAVFLLNAAKAKHDREVTENNVVETVLKRLGEGKQTNQNGES